MSQKSSPFVDVKYGWDYGESGWNTGMDENLTKFSFLFDKNIDGVVSSLPSVVNGTAYFLTTDNRIYFGVSNSWYSSPTPKWFTLIVRSTGASYQFNGSSLVAIPNNSDLSSQVQSIQVTLSSLGTAAFQPATYFASQAALDVASAQASSYTDTKIAALTKTSVGLGNVDNTSDLNKPISTATQTALQKRVYFVDAISDLRAITDTTITRVSTNRYWTGLSGGAGSYIKDPSDTTSADNGVTVIVTTGGIRFKLIHDGCISITQAGAKGDSVTYDHVAVQAAVSTGLTVHIPRTAGMYRLGTAITCVTPGQLIYGDGKNVSFFLVDTTFTMASLGVFIGLTGEPGPQFKYFGVSFIQPETSVRANLTTYPAAFYVRGNPRVLMDGVKIMNASRGIDAQGNCGGSSFLNIDCSAYDYTIILDGSFDSVRIHGMHNWPFGMLAANQLIFKEAAAVGILSGRCDDLRISDSLFFCGTQLSTILTANGFTGGVCTGVCFDTNPRVSIGAGIMQFANCTFSTGIATANAISVTGAGTRVQMTGCSYLCAVALGGPLVSVVGSPNTSISIVGGRFDTGNFDVSSFAISSANAVISGSTFDRAAGTAYAQPTVSINTGGRLTASCNRATDKGAGAGVFMAFTADDYHNITGNTSPGWTYVKPTFTTGVFVNNN